MFGSATESSTRLSRRLFATLARMSPSLVRLASLSWSPLHPILISTSSADVSGTFEGAVARDTISVGALSVANQDLAVMPASSLSDSSPFSGIIGLAFPSVSKIGKPTLLENLVAAGTLKNNLFSFYFSRNGTSGSELTLGGVDPDKHTGGFLRAPVVSGSHACPFFFLL